MLLVAAGVQWTLLATHHNPVIYSQADFFLFVLHLTFLNVWFEHGPGYNYASWSVCAEVFVYILFFVFARARKNTFLIASALSVFVGIAVLSGIALPLEQENGPCAGRFLHGRLGLPGDAPRVAARVGARRRNRVLRCPRRRARHCQRHQLRRLDWRRSTPLWSGAVSSPHRLGTVFPAAGGAVLPPVDLLGDISYAIYLSHIPVQMILLSLTTVPALRFRPPARGSSGRG